jgi:hypothetical protein
VRSSMFAALCAGSLLIGVAAPLRGDYWTQFQSRPDAPYPENQGWQRVVTPSLGGALRSIDNDGDLMLDSRASGGIVDYYAWTAPGMIHADPGHPFAQEWRLCVDSTTSVTEVGAGLYSDDRWAAGFEITSDRIYDAYAYPKSVAFEPGWHTFRFLTPDMRTYALAIDGVEAMSGSFQFRPDDPLTSRVLWGDGGQGGTSVSRWSYSGFGIVPEPASLGGYLGLILFLRTLRRGMSRPLTPGGVS